MKIAVLLYGQIRTLKYCLPSIKRLFKDLLKGDFYVCINTNNDTHFENNLCDGGFSNKATLNINELDQLIGELYPIFYEKITINKEQLKKESLKFEPLLNEFNIFNTTWSEYRKTPYNRELNDIEVCKKYGCELKNISINQKKNFIIEICNVESHMRLFLLYNLHKIKKNYDYVCFVRTDTIFFDKDEAFKYILSTLKIEPEKISNFFTGGMIIETSIQKKITIEYNKNIVNMLFINFINDFKKLIHNKEDGITLYLKSKELNTMLPIEQFGVYRYNKVVPIDIISLSETFYKFKELFLKELLEKLYSKYPIMDTGAWWGEQAQKRRHILFRNDISEEIQFHKYFCIFRNEKSI